MSPQEKAESLVYECVSDLEDYFQIQVATSPEVIYVSRNTRFESLGLPRYLRDDFEENKYSKRSWYAKNLQIIFLSSFHPSDIGEETGHFIHYSLTGLHSVGNLSGYDHFSLAVLSEMLGYFCSKIVDPSRSYPQYLQKPRLFYSSKEQFESIVSGLVKEYGEIDLDEYKIYQEGYMLGELLYQYTETGLLPNSIPRTLIKKRFDQNASPLVELVKIQKRLDVFPQNL
jgi:hypothetical protein